MTSGIRCGTRWGGCLGVRPGCNVMSPCDSTLGVFSGAVYDVVSGVCTLRGGVTCGGAALVNIYVIFLRADVCLSPNVVSGIVGVGLSRVWLMSAAACVAASFDNIIGNVSVSR